jgi:hypothetical protein
MPCVRVLVCVSECVSACVQICMRASTRVYFVCVCVCFVYNVRALVYTFVLVWMLCIV